MTMSEIPLKEAETSLFAEWRAVESRFVEDGAVDEVAYHKSRPRLLFVLKEVNDPDGGDWDLREFLRNGGRAQTWDSVARWVKAIRSLPAEVLWKNFPTDPIAKAEFRKCELASIVAINLKKSPGGHTTEPGLLAEHAQRDKELIKRQIALYGPDLVICCGSAVADLLATMYPIIPWSVTARGIYHGRLDDAIVISAPHPEVRIQESIPHYALIDAIRELTNAVTT